MTRPLVVLRPEPGNAATVTRIVALGLTPVALPLFAIRALDWTPPDPAAFDALLLTSANAVRHAGAGLAALRDLPVVAVGPATARAAEAAGLAVAMTGEADGIAAVRLARAAGHARLLRLTGRDHVPLPGIENRMVYASEEIAVPPGAIGVADGAVLLLHSPRAARHVAALAAREGIARERVRVAALSAAVAQAAGPGWGDVAVAPQPTDDALLAVAAALAIDP